MGFCREIILSNMNSLLISKRFHKLQEFAQKFTPTSITKNVITLITNKNIRKLTVRQSSKTFRNYVTTVKTGPNLLLKNCLAFKLSAAFQMRHTVETMDSIHMYANHVNFRNRVSVVRLVTHFSHPSCNQNTTKKNSITGLILKRAPSRAVIIIIIIIITVTRKTTTILTTKTRTSNLEKRWKDCCNRNLYSSIIPGLLVEDIRYRIAVFFFFFFFLECIVILYFTFTSLFDSSHYISNLFAISEEIKIISSVENFFYLAYINISSSPLLYSFSQYFFETNDVILPYFLLQRTFT